MKLLIICIIALFTQPKPPTFQQEFVAFDQALYNYLVAKGTNGDTITTKAAMLTTGAALNKWDVPAEMAKIPVIQRACRWGCTGQFYYFCINLVTSTYEAQLCLNEYESCVRTCGYIPF